MYSYVRNNPTTLTDPTGLYTANCGDDVKKCSKQIADFDRALQRALTSENEDIRKAAQAYGALGEKNGVSVTVANVVDPKHADVLGTVTAQAGTGGATYDENTKIFQQATQASVAQGSPPKPCGSSMSFIFVGRVAYRNGKAAGYNSNPALHG